MHFAKLLVLIACMVGCAERADRDPRPRWNMVTIHDFDAGTVETYGSLHEPGCVWIATGRTDTDHFRTRDRPQDNASAERKVRQQAAQGIRAK